MTFSIFFKFISATVALTKLKLTLEDDNMSLGSKVKLMCSIVISIFLYVCEWRILTVELEKRKKAFRDEMLPKAIEHLVQRLYYY